MSKKKSDFYVGARVIVLRCVEHDISPLPRGIACDCVRKGRVYVIESLLAGSENWNFISSAGIAFNWEQLEILP